MIVMVIVTFNISTTFIVSVTLFVSTTFNGTVTVIVVDIVTVSTTSSSLTLQDTLKPYYRPPGCSKHRIMIGTTIIKPAILRESFLCFTGQQTHACSSTYRHVSLHSPTQR